MKPQSFFSKILVCVEDSACANKALMRACDLARRNNSKLFLIYVVYNPTSGLGLGIELIDRGEFVKMFRDHGKKVLKKASTIATENGVKAIPVMKEGNVATEIIKFAKKERIDLIAIGSRGLSRLPRYILGSISNKIANYAPCQVLVVK
ncbi:MAG: universal stress protein [Thaumarchaeota archaeon]|nr:universal stress protein [Nitrososphaerota archaeon]